MPDQAGDDQTGDDQTGELRQAIVLIHGIGEQRPMATLRQFVEAVLGQVGTREPGKPLYYSKPDTIDQTFELRRLIAYRPRRTDFYELYWAHLMPLASTNRIKSWYLTLMWRGFGEVPPRIRAVWLVSWALLLAAVAFGAVTVFQFFSGEEVTGWPLADAPAALTAFALLISLAARSYIGDAAVYLSPAPENIEARRRIRTCALSLLQKLNEDPRYERVVVVGHSLGSVIGYDALNLCWQARVRQLVAGFYADLAASRATPNPMGAMVKAEKLLKQAADGMALSTEAWIDMARQVAAETAASPIPWKVTDFITLGSPLNYGGFLLAKGRGEFETRKQQREYSESPPRLEHKGFTYYQRGVDPGGCKRGIRVPHHAAPFCATVWTNLHFGSRLLVWGDLIGGPVAPQFGMGIRDIRVRTSRRWGFLAHTRYWSPDARLGQDSALAVLCRTLDLARSTPAEPTPAAAPPAPAPSATTPAV